MSISGLSHITNLTVEAQIRGNKWTVLKVNNGGDRVVNIPIKQLPDIEAVRQAIYTGAAGRQVLTGKELHTLVADYLESQGITQGWC